MHPEQYGFREQTSTIDALYQATKRVKEAKAQGKHVVWVSLEIQGAFNNAWWPKLLDRLLHTN